MKTSRQPKIVAPKRVSTGGWNGAPKIVFIKDGRELHGHACRTVAEAEDYIKTIGPIFLKIAYD